MRNFRKAIATLSVVAILSSLVVSTAFAGTFGDVPADAYYYNAVETLASEGIIDASKTSFDPARQLQRQEAAKLIVESAGLVADLPEVASFTDVPKTLWSFESVETAKANGVVNGYTDANGTLTGKFGPTDTVTRAQFAKMVVEAFDLPMYTPDSPTFPDVMDTNAWYYEYVETAAYHGVVKGFADGSFGANKQIVRQDGAVMIYRALGMEVDPGDDDDMDDDDYIPGDIDITLGDTPASAVVPKNATRVPYLTMDVDGEGTLKSMTFERFGAGAPGDFSNVYLYEGDTRLTTGRTINSSTHRVIFTGLNYEVSGMSELTVVADMSGSGNGNVDGFRLYEVTSDDNVSFSEVEGELMSISNASVGSVTVSNSGGTPTNPKVGEKNVKISEFKLEAGSSEAVDVYGISLYQGGGISRSNLSNFVLMQAGVEVASSEELTSQDLVVLTLDSPFSLSKGSSRIFELYADVGTGARVDDTIIVYLDNDSDLDATGATYGYGVDVVNTNFDSSSTTSSTQVEGGELTISFQGPSVQDYAVDSNDVELMRFSVVAQNDIEIRKTHVQLGATSTFAAASNGLLDTTGATVANYTDIKLVDVDTGDVLVGPMDLVTTTAADGVGNDVNQTLDFTDIWNLDAGEAKTLVWTADIANYTPSSDKVTLTFNQFGPNEVKNLENNQWVDPTTIVPNTNIVGNTHSIVTASTSASKAGTPVLMNYINGSTGLDMLGVVVRAGNAKDVYLKSMTVKVTGLGNCTTEANCVSKVKLFDGTTQIGTDKSVTADTAPAITSTAVFSNLNVKIQKGVSKTIMVKSDLSRQSPLAGTERLQYEVTAMTVQDIDGNTVSVSGLTVSGPNHYILDEGSLSVTKAANETGVTDSRIVVAGTSGVTLAKFRFTASREALKLSKVPVSIGSAVGEVKNVYLYDGSTMIAGPVTPESNGIAYFTSFTSDFVVPKDSSKTLSVLADLSTTSESDTSGTSVTVTLDNALGDAIDAGDVYAFEAKSASGSNTTLDAAGATDVPGNTMIVRKSKITVSKVALTDTDITNGAEEDIYKFTVEADSANDVSLKQLKFNITLSDNNNNNTLELKEFKLFDGSSNISNEVRIVTQAGVDLENPLNTYGEADSVAIVTFIDELSINAGDTKTLTLKATTLDYGTGDDNDSISVSLGEDVAPQGATVVHIEEDGNGIVNLVNSTNGADTTANIIWSDYGYFGTVTAHSFDAVPAAPGVSDSSNDWINGYLLKNMPIGSSTMSN